MKNKTQSITLFSLLATLLLAATGAFANPSPIDPDFIKLDNDHDGLISWPEFTAKNPVSGRLDPRRIFDNVDTNLDSYIDPAEFSAMKNRERA